MISLKWQIACMCVKIIRLRCIKSLPRPLPYSSKHSTCWSDMLPCHAFGTFTPDFRIAEARPQKLMIAQGNCANTRQTWAKCGRFFLRIAFICSDSLCLRAQPGWGVKPKSITCSLFMTVIRLWRKPCYPHSVGLCGPLTKKKNKKWHLK